ncbi:MAG: hypothetical protein U0521_08000 [Anaerolineae bacterium]
MAFGWDLPVEPMGSLIGIHAAVTRQRADGSPVLTAGIRLRGCRSTRALRGYTIGAAYAAGWRIVSVGSRPRLFGGSRRP